MIVSVLHERLRLDRGADRASAETPPAVLQRVALDIAYIERQSFWFDLYIMLMTVPCLLGDRKVAR